MIPFTQYLRPDGRKRSINIERPAEVEELAMKLVRRGLRLEAEELCTGEVSFTVFDGEKDIAIEICPNGPDVPHAVDRLIKDATATVEKT